MDEVRKDAPQRTQTSEVWWHTHRQKEEKGQPAQDEHPHDDGQRLGSLLLPGELHKAHGQGAPERVVLAAFGGRGARVLQDAATVYPQHHLHRLVPVPFHARFQTLGSPAGHHVDPEVHEEDDQEREVEGEERGEERVTGLLGDPADAVVQRRRLLPAQQGTHGDHRGQHPHQHQDGHRFPLRHDAGVLQAVLDADVAVHGDDAEAEDGGGAAQHVHRCPDVAEDAAEHPASQHLQGRGKRQHDDAQQQVGHGQVDDEEVGDGLQVFVAHHGQDDQDVADDGHQDEDGEDDPDADHLRVQREVGAGGAVGKDVLQHRSIESSLSQIDPIVAVVPQVRVCHFDTP